jgi:hypothetical protein
MLLYLELFKRIQKKQFLYKNYLGCCQEKFITKHFDFIHATKIIIFDL